MHVWSDEEEQYLPQGHSAVNAAQCAELQGRCRGMLLDTKLAPYPMQQSMQWASLCHSITRDVLGAVLPVGGYIRPQPLLQQPAQEAASGRGGQATAAASAQPSCDASTCEPELDMAAVGQLQRAAAEHDSACAPGGRFFFTSIPGTGYSATGAWKTAYGVDPSGCLIKAVEAAGGAASLLAQLQIAFIAFALGESLHAYEAWKHMFAAVPRAEWLITDAYGDGCGGSCVPVGISGGATMQCPESGLGSEFFVRAFQIMTEQVKLLPDEFSAEDLTPSSFVQLVDKRLRGTVARHGSRRQLELAPYQVNTQQIPAKVEQSIELFLVATKVHLRASNHRGAQIEQVRPSFESSVASARLSADEVRSIMGDNWDGDDDEDLPVVVDLSSGVSIS